MNIDSFRTSGARHATRHAGQRGFSLIELLIVMVIIAVLVTIGIFATSAMREKAWATSAAMRLRQCATGIQNYAAEKGRYPESWDFGGGSGGGSWSWQIRDYIGYSEGAPWPSELVLHSRHGKTDVGNIPASLQSSLHHFAASTVVLQDVDESNSRDTKKYIRPWQVSSPATTIMLGDAPLKKAGDPLSGSHAAWWSIRPQNATGSPDEPINQQAIKNDVDFWLKGKATFLFVDGHIETLAPEEVLKRNFQL